MKKSLAANPVAYGGWTAGPSGRAKFLKLPVTLVGASLLAKAEGRLESKLNVPPSSPAGGLPW